MLKVFLTLGLCELYTPLMLMRYTFSDLYNSNNHPLAEEPWTLGACKQSYLLEGSSTQAPESDPAEERNGHICFVRHGESVEPTIM